MKAPRGRKALEQLEYERILWPGSAVYRNKLDIHDQTELERAERMLVAHRAEQGLPGAAHPLSYAGFRAIHRHLFQDLYDWAGEERRYTTGRGPVPFAIPEKIAPWMETQFQQLEDKRFLVGLSLDRFAEEAGSLVTEINAAHPFVDGNGRTQRNWLRALAGHAGHRLVLQADDREAWNDVARIGFEQGDAGPVSDLLRARLTTPRQKPEHRQSRRRRQER